MGFIFDPLKAINHISYASLVKEYRNEASLIPYAELLKTAEWENKRKEILQRDGHNCKRCHNGETITQYINGEANYYFVTMPKELKGHRVNYHVGGKTDFFYIYDDRAFIYTLAERHSYLHVHHTFYDLSVLPWEYDNESLELLCVHCHFHLHQTEQVPVFKTENGFRIRLCLTPCSRCCGAGVLPQFDYYMDGICFKCYGAKYQELI